MSNVRTASNVQVLSVAKKEWILSPVCTPPYVDASRYTVLCRAMSSIQNPHKVTETLLDEALRADKLHDGHPKIIVDKIEEEYPTFFLDLPGPGNLNETKKKAFISEFITCELRNGIKRYSKPNLRKKSMWDDELR